MWHSKFYRINVPLLAPSSVESAYSLASHLWLSLCLPLQHSLPPSSCSQALFSFFKEIMFSAFETFAHAVPIAWRIPLPQPPFSG